MVLLNSKEFIYMYKKFVSIGVLFVMVLSVTACSCNIDIPTQLDRELLEHKASEKTELEAYAESKGKDNYTAENWAVIEGILALAKSAIDAAADKAAVDKAVKAAEATIDAVMSEIANYKMAMKTMLEIYVEIKGEDNYYTAENWAAIGGLVNGAKAMIDAAADKAGVVSALKAAKQAIDAVEEEIPFPSSLEGFNDKFFKKYTLILLPFNGDSDTDYYYLELTSVFVENVSPYSPRENGKLNFLIERTITEDDTGRGGPGRTDYLFAAIISNELFSEYGIVEGIKDPVENYYGGTYGVRNFSTNYWNHGELTERPRSPSALLTAAEENRVPHQAGLFLDGRWLSKIDVYRKPIAVTSVEELNNLMD